MIKEKLVYRLAWYDWNGGAYDRSFDTEEERAGLYHGLKRQIIKVISTIISTKFKLKFSPVKGFIFIKKFQISNKTP